MFQISRFAPLASKLVLAHLKPDSSLTHDCALVKVAFCIACRALCAQCIIAICAGSKTATAGLVFGMAKVGQGVAGAAIAPAQMHGVCAQRKRAHSRAAKRIAPLWGAIA